MYSGVENPPNTDRENPDDGIAQRPSPRDHLVTPITPRTSVWDGPWKVSRVPGYAAALAHAAKALWNLSFAHESGVGLPKAAVTPALDACGAGFPVA